MAQEEQNLSSSHSGGGGGGGDSGGGGVSSDRSRNVKHKKIPQRGLGVAQLEKIRLEEQRKREAVEAANALANNAIGSANDAAPSLAVQSPSFGPLPANFQSPNTLFRSPPSIPIQISNRLSGGVEDASLQAISGSGNGSWSRLWNGGDYSLGAAFRPQGNSQFESNAVAAPMPQRSFRFHQPATPVVNPSAVLTSYMEPPSNQNIHGSNCPSLWPEEYKMVGMKRSYPFSLESPPARPFLGHFDPSSISSKSRSDELPSCSNGYTTQTEARNIYMSFSQDGRPNPSLLPEQNPREVLRDGWRLNGDFLTLAPTAAALPASTSKHKYPLDFSSSQGLEENMRNQVQHSGPSRSREEPFSFFPVRSDIDETGRVNNGSGEKGETIDLNLKL